MINTSIDDTFAAEFELTETVEEALTKLDALKQAQAQFLALLHERIAELKERQRGLSMASPARTIINGQIGLVQTIKHDFERIITNATTRTP